MNKNTAGFRQGYDQGFTDAICGEVHTRGHPETSGERDWADGYYEGQVAGQPARTAAGPGGDGHG